VLGRGGGGLVAVVVGAAGAGGDAAAAGVGGGGIASPDELGAALLLLRFGNWIRAMWRHLLANREAAIGNVPASDLTVLHAGTFPIDAA